MADAQANIGIGVDTSQALAAIRQLQREISAFHTSMAKGGALANAESMRLSQNLINTINAGGQFSAGMTRISSSTESFTTALEKNKLSMSQYFRYAGGASKSFGKLFTREFNTINRVATERVKDLQTQYISMGRDANGALQAIKVRPLALDMDNLGTKVQMVAQRQQLFNQLLKQGSTNLLNFGKNTQWAGRQLMVGFTIPLTIFGATAAREFQKLEEQAVKFRRVYGDMFTTDAETEKALANIRELADEFTKYGIAVEKTVGLAAKVAQMGNVGTDLTEQVTQATRLAVLGGLEQEEALDTTISLTNAFGVAAEDLAGKIAFLNAAENQTILAIEDFNEAIPKAGSVVQQLGGDVEDLAFMLTAMREGGINASQAANAIKSSLGRMINPTEAAKQKLSAFGIDIVGIVEGNVGNLNGTITQLGYALDELDPLDRARAIETLFGKFQFARMSTMFSNIVKEGSQANKVLGLTANSTEELAIIAERELKRVEESPAFKLQKQMEALKASLAPIGAEFIKAVTPIIEFGTKLFKAFNNLGDGGKQFIVVLTAIAGVVAPAALMMFGLIANGVANLIKFFALLGNGFARLSGSSRILGTGTEYLTQQQIEAAAVAASLGQSHSNLIQVFTAEASAVRGLANAYRQATIAQSAFRPTGAAGFGAMPKPKGYADGGMIVGPGTGTSDSIPAMVSDGEFIMNAKRTKQYLPFLQLMAKGKLPGFSSPEGGTQVSLGPGTKPIRNEAVELTRELSGATGELDTSLLRLADKLESTFKRFERVGVSAEEATERIRAAASQRENAEKEIKSLGAYSASGTQSAVEGQLSRMVPQQLHQESIQRMPAKEAASKFDDGSAASRFVQTWNEYDPEAEVDIKSMWTRKGSQYANKELDPNQSASGFGMPVDDAINEFQTFAPGVEKYEDAIAAGGGKEALDDPEVIATYQAYDQEMIRLQEAAKARQVEFFVDSKEDVERLVAREREAQGEGFDEGALRSKVLSYEEMDEEAASVLSPRGKEIRETAKAKGRSARVRATKADLDQMQIVANDPDQPQERRDAASELLNVYQEKGKPKPTARERFFKGDGAAPKDGVSPASLSTEDAQEALSSTQAVLDRPENDPYMQMVDEGARNSPHNLSGIHGQEDAAEYMASFQAASSNADPLAPPPPPEVGYMPDDNSLRGRLRGLGNRAADKFNDSAIGQGIGKKFSDMTGAPLADSQGNLVYDPDAAVSSGAPLPVRVVDGFEMDPEFQRTMEEGTINTENLNQTMAKNKDATDKNTDVTSKEVKKTDKMQRRGALAGKMMAGLGTVTMAAGMATQVEGVVGETAQGLVGPLAAITGILPALTAMGPLWGTLLGIIGGGVALWMMHNAALKKAREEAFALAKAMGTGKEAIQKFADFSGRVTSGEIAAQRRQNRQNPLQLQPGQKTFGSAFVEDDAGQALVENTRKSLQRLGKDATISSLYTQLGTAVTQGALSSQEAVSIAAALSEEIGDYGIGMSVNAKLIELLGPNGENVLTEPLKIETQAKLMEDSVEASAEALTRSFNTIEMFTGPSTSPGSYQDPYMGTGANGQAPAILLNPDAQSMVDAEAESRMEGANWWTRNITIPWQKATGQIADELRSEAIGASMGQFSNNLEMASQAIDAQRLSTQNLIDEAIKNGATESEIADLKRQEAEAIDQLMASLDVANQQLFEWWDGLPKADRVNARNDQEARIKSAAEEKGLDPTTVGADLIKLRKNAQGVDTTDQEEMRVNMVIRSAVESGDLDEAQLASIVDNFNSPEEKSIISELILDVGPGETGNLLSFLNQIDDETLKSSIMLDFKDGDTEGSLERISDLDALYRTSPIFDGVDIPINFFTTGEGDLKSTMDMADEIRNKAESGSLFEDGEIDMGAYADIVGQDVAERAAVAADAIGEEFDNLDEAGKLEFFTNFAINAQFSGDPDAIAFYKSKAQEMNLNLDFGTTGSSQEQSAADRVQAEQIMNYIPTTRAVNAPGDGDDNDLDGGGGGKESIDDLLVGLRNTRQATIDMKRGWDGMQESLQKFLDDGVVGFNGLSNQMRRLGVGEGLIERITGMDPDEYEKRKNELFVFDEAGNIIGTTQKLQNMGAAMNKLALGEYINSQQSFIENTNNQFTAMQKLTAEGLSFVEAYEMVQDQALATAIAMGITKEETAELIRITQMMTEMREKYDRISEEEQAAKAVKQTNKEFNDRVAVLNKLASQQGKYTDEEINAILNDSNLSTLFLNPKIDSKSLSKALENARRAADLELQIKVATEEGKKTLFDELVGGVQDEFNRQEAKIDIDFRLATRDDQDIVNQAQNQIAAIQYQIDDYEAQLKGIEDQEEVINEKYDDRYKALEEVAAANERIQRLRSAELDIADALSRGDIAAAARAQQELRATEAQNASEEQKEMLQRQQEAELARVRSASGASREELEDRIKELQDEIFGVEENSLEPAQERLRIAEYEKQLQIDALEVSGKTRDVWDQIANATDIATQNTEEFAKNVERALALYEYFVNGIPLDMNLFGEELEAQLKDMGVNVGEQKAIAAATNIASGITPRGDGEKVDTRLTELEQAALRVADLNSKVATVEEDRIREIRAKLDSPLSAQNESTRLAEAAGVGTAASADHAERMINKQIEAEAVAARQELIEDMRVATRDFAKLVMGTDEEGNLAAVSIRQIEAAYESAKDSITKKAAAAGQSTAPRGTSSSGSSSSGSSSSGGSSSGGSSSSRPTTLYSAAPKEQSRAVASAAGVGRATTADAAERRINSFVAANPRAAAVASSRAAYEASGMSLRAYMRSAGGIIPGYSIGGRVKGYAAGGFSSLGSDNIPAMLTPGEYVVRKRAVQDFGMGNLEAINNGEYSGGSVYNYNLAVNVRSEADPNRIAKTVMKQIQRVESQRVRGNRI